MSGGDRLFYGIPLPPEQAQRIHAVAQGHGSWRAVPAANLHVTLRFLGTTGSRQRSELEALLAGAELPARFGVAVGEWGAFPGPRRARVAWIGVEDPTGRLSTLADVLERVARLAGFRPERRPFRAHVTFARLPEPADLRSVLGSLPEVRFSLKVDAFTLFRSVLSSGPPRYEPLVIHTLPPLDGTKLSDRGVGQLNHGIQEGQCDSKESDA